MAGYSLRALIGIAATVLLALIGAAQSYSLLTSYSRGNPDVYVIGRQTERLAGVAARLPENAVVGYISDMSTGDRDGITEFFGVQYALAPRLLVEESGRRRQEWVVGSFRKRPDLAEIEKKYGLRMVETFPLGVTLFRRAQ